MKKTKSKNYNLKKKKRNTFKKRKIKKTKKQVGGASYLWGKNKRLWRIPNDIMVKLNDRGFSKTLSKDNIFKIQLEQLAYKVSQKYPKSNNKCKLYMLFSFLPHAFASFYPFHPSFVLTGIDGNGDGDKDTKDISTTNYAYQGMYHWEEGGNLLFTQRPDGIAENIINSKNFTLRLEGNNEALIYFGYFEDDEEAQAFSEAVTDRSESGYTGFQKPYNVLTNNCQHYASYALQLLKSGNYNFESADEWLGGKMINIDLNQFGEGIKQYIDENSEKLEEYATSVERAIAKSMASSASVGEAGRAVGEEGGGQCTMMQ